jgi:hypothetical protein
LPFWENVYGFDMSCIGKEVTGNSARFPVVDILASEDIVTETAVLNVSPMTYMLQLGYALMFQYCLFVEV